MANSNPMPARAKQATPGPPRRRQMDLVYKPPVDIFQTDDAITLVADMPGVAPDDIAIDLQDGVLRLSGRVRPWEGPGESDVRVEFEIGRYLRRIALPVSIAHDRIDAGCRDGTLRLTLPLAAKSRPKAIPIKNG